MAREFRYCVYCHMDWWFDEERRCEWCGGFKTSTEVVHQVPRQPQARAEGAPGLSSLVSRLPSSVASRLSSPVSPLSSSPEGPAENLADMCGTLASVNDELLRENAMLRRRLEKAEKKR
jgi:hypothetical protein